MALGLGLTDGFDVGAIFSLYAAAFVLFQSFIPEGKLAQKCVTGTGRVAGVAICAALMAAQALTTLIGTQIKGIVGMEQTRETKQKRWEQATLWSLPRTEALRIIVPGLFGYRMPELYDEPVQSVNGSNYWGSVGQGAGQFRFSGEGEFAGVLVALIAVWAGVQSFRRKNNPFTNAERKFIWFWAGAAILSLLLAFGKYAPFYQLVYSLPYFSTMRNPFKFLHPLHVALVILFAYGLQGLYRCLLTPAPRPGSALAQLRSWWKTAPAFDRKWTLGCLAAVGASLLGWLIYASSKNDLIGYLQQAGFPERQYPQLAAAIARFSLGEVGLFILFLMLSIALLTLMLSGAFSGRKAKWAGVALGLLLVIDLSRADVPWIVYYNYKDKYAANPIIDLLRDKPVEHRITAEITPLSRQYLINEDGANFQALYYGEWLQHHFQYYRIQSLDIIQLPRAPEFDLGYMRAFLPATQTNLLPIARLWQLTNTRYVLGMTGFLELLNSQVDPVQRRFRVHTAFNIAPRPGVTEVTRREQLTAVPDPKGRFALFEFTGALPRVKLFPQWQVNTNDQATLQQLRNPDFDPAQTVVVADELPPANPTNATPQAAGTVEFAHYEPKFLRLNAHSDAPCVLLLNDHFDPDWKVFVDGKPDTLLRCNYIMRGVYLAPGRHVVEFRFAPAAAAFYVSLGSLIAGVALCGFLAVSSRSPQSKETLARPPGRN
ncbi:MAG: hypothetical protein DME19_07095 [Verrucomicrobia bacterium]|nr:MAG: hypothetical protein DME19_07095 [Verrucomicrobiota bacterium]